MASEPPNNADAERVLVLVPSRRDAALTIDLLARDRVRTLACADVAEVARLSSESALALIAEEALAPEGTEELVRELRRQPAWSDFPIVILSERRSDPPLDAARWARLGNVSLLERPVRVLTMQAAVRAALRARRRQYEARRAIESRDQFLAMLGHELRNPLAAIRLAGDLVARAPDRAAIERHAAVIERQSRHLGRLVDDLLDVARVSYGKVTLHREPLDLSEVVRGTAQALEQAFRGAGIELRVTVQAGLRVRGDRVRLDQVFSNVLTNAIKYTPRGGRVTLDARARGASAVVSVADNGIGIAPEMLDKVFDLFAQADRSLERAQGGLGIGLTLVRSLVAMHDGVVRAASPGLASGSTFEIELPLLATPRAERDASGPRLLDASAPLRVGVVEDTEDIRTMLKEALELEGHTVTTASDGPSGVRMILDGHPDIAFVDIGLPGFDGYELARRVRAAGARVPLVALTGYGQQQDRRLARAAGFDGHLTKPVEIERLHSAMATLGHDAAPTPR